MPCRHAAAAAIAIMMVTPLSPFIAAD